MRRGEIFSGTLSTYLLFDLILNKIYNTFSFFFAANKYFIILKLVRTRVQKYNIMMKSRIVKHVLQENIVLFSELAMHLFAVFVMQENGRQ